MVAPGRDDEVARALLVALLQIDAGERGLAGAGLRARMAEERLDLVGAGIVEEQGRLGLLAQLVLAGPIGMGETELLDRFGVAVDAGRSDSDTRAQKRGPRGP